MRQLTLQFGSDPIAVLAGYLGGTLAMLEEATRSFLCDGRVTPFPIDVPERVLTEAAAAIWTTDELAELRALQQAFARMRRPDDETLWPDYERAWLEAWKAESLCRARLIRRVSPRWAAYWERGWR